MKKIIFLLLLFCIVKIQAAQPAQELIKQDIKTLLGNRTDTGFIDRQNAQNSQLPERLSLRPSVPPTPIELPELNNATRQASLEAGHVAILAAAQDHADKVRMQDNYNTNTNGIFFGSVILAGFTVAAMAITASIQS